MSGGLFQPGRGLDGVGFHPDAVEIAHGQVAHGGGIVLFGGLEVELGSPDGVVFHAGAVFIA